MLRTGKMPEIKRCPFCGGKVKAVLEKWNRRAEPPNPPLTLDELRGLACGSWLWLEDLLKDGRAPFGSRYCQKFDPEMISTGMWIGYKNPDWCVLYSLKEYGRTWQAYRYQPEREKESGGMCTLPPRRRPVCAGGVG